MAIIVLVGVTLYQSSSPEEENRAAIVDGLLGFPNPGFVQEATSILNSSGYIVDYYPPQEVTVDLYRTLPSKGYELIILRVHAGPLVETLPDGTKIVGEEIVLFTAEIYDQQKYPIEQLSGNLAKATIIGQPEKKYFAIPPRFISNSLEGEFKETVIILDSCYAFHGMIMAEALIDKGVSTYIGWDGEVAATHTDKAVLTLLDAIYKQELSIGQSVEKTMEEIGPDPDYGSSLLYYPKTEK